MLQPSSLPATPELRELEQRWTAAPYRSYLYSYPHKTAYRDLSPAEPLKELWERDQTDYYFLYMHIPFCGARCGFCNLFTLPDRRASVHEQYVDALHRQAEQWAPWFRGRTFSRFAIGGGTPTLLEAAQLNRLFDIAEHTMGLDPRQASISVETSPETVTEDRMRVLKDRLVDRISMGIQSFVEDEAAAIYRPQKPKLAEEALEKLIGYQFPLINIDLIYGLPGQTPDTWLYSLEKAIGYGPGEIFIYPLYTRENTILKPDQIRSAGTDIRLELYHIARQRLEAAGYRQYSMRRFAKETNFTHKSILPFSCQEEGMAGLGCGARSYTRDVHYASRYGVSAAATRSIIEDYVAAERHDTADYGFRLSVAEQKRRFLLKALLHREGLALDSYEARFGSDAVNEHSDLQELLSLELAELDEGILRLTTRGMAYSDAIGDELISGDVRELMNGYIVR
ncbi:oxygen-independent coproporphyrinogen-3 oxidase [Paenibacillus endophyticus]|uniref:Heme chaperone HemW n=1 Tax=Paenibacillus endophyticus TaxID=1294268 RepID=A0A7W5C7G7_9BACL|nr:STM4012 family radical SAM protein [Paenibacillus endophyticus]MBB3152567.1 oxygen-independent coproporphyrinogen-3 oxidase [Paenibacillus endophyticus]